MNKNNKIGIFFGTNTGNTEKISKIINNKIGEENSILFDISLKNSIDNISNFKYMLFGIPTWYYGELQYDWENIIDLIKSTDFNNKYIGLFGCGDQINYSDNFCDAIYLIYNILKKNNANIIGLWPNKFYFFKKTKSLDKKSNNFFGLTIDEDNQSEKTDERINIWLNIIKKDLNKNNENIFSWRSY
ncbi:flavodoxin [endosymbiont of Sipalinus gigas]|uniref:flavodoxin n=1 Tax=endosymbiont of Sipalinus gigas TaxID=1972134 RepID=UPI000DC70B08|nr:flavodoxin [endosymbiont of Sipalinus gigas]BBA85347.1 flavodoxin [endosymbiont of Sipalinus gigas]